MLRQLPTSVTPQQMASLTVPLTDPSAVTFRLLDNKGALVLEKIEGQLAAADPSDYTLGQRVDPPWIAHPQSESDYALRADFNERLANYDYAKFDYSDGLSLFPGSPLLSSGFGRLWEVLANPDAAAAYLSPSAADAETQYYGALARQDPLALASVQADPVYGVAASVRMAQILAAGGDSDAGLTALRAVQSKSARVGAVELALLRSLGRSDELADRAAYWAAIDPTDVNIRYELSLLGQDDGGLWPHLAADPERILNVAEHLMALGQFAEALDVLSNGYDNLRGVRIGARHSECVGASFDLVLPRLLQGKNEAFGDGRISDGGRTGGEVRVPESLDDVGRAQRGVEGLAERLKRAVAARVCPVVDAPDG